MPETSINHREFYRLRYPIMDRPKLELNGQQFEVTEIAERSLQFARVVNLIFQIGQEISGTVTFHDGQTVNIVGKLGRIRRNEGVIVELEGVDLARMFKEQFYLNAKFPRVKMNT
ncbi:MAG: hypothetical protein ABL888_19110 [Pirellulaceae bacterium]